MQKLASTNIKIIDIRSIDAYNGWRLKDEKRGGHVKGAKSLPYKWHKYIDWIEILMSKGFESTDEIIVYGYDEQEIDDAAEGLQKLGFLNVKSYMDFVSEWSANESLPMDKLERYNHLVSAEWLQSLLTTGHALEYTNSNFVLCHAHYRNPKDYELGHIPQALALDTNSLESTETWNRRSPEELQKVFEEMGITSDTTVILYGRFSFPKNEDDFPGSSAGHLGAMRCAFILLYAGVKDVKILNGGLQSWIDAGYKLTKEEFKPTPVENFGVTIPAHPEYAVDVPEAKEMIQSPQANLVCVRSWPEYLGKVSGYNYIVKTGRIPGAVFGNCGSDAYHMENYRNLDHTMREYQEIAQLWTAVGITPDKHNAFYCGTGWRGSEAFMNAWLMGWPKVSVFDGGWFEWSNDESNPIETGDPTR